MPTHQPTGTRTLQNSVNNLYNKADMEAVIARLESLTPDSKRQWGTMDIGQMLAHCNVSLETAMGRNFPKRKLIGRIFGKLLKWKFLDKKPMVINSPTEDIYLTTQTPETYDFEYERGRAIELIRIFHENGPAKCTTHPHSYFGKLSPEEWAVLKWKHYDHHLRQFGA